MYGVDNLLVSEKISCIHIQETYESDLPSASQTKLVPLDLVPCSSFPNLSTHQHSPEAAKHCVLLCPPFDLHLGTNPPGPFASAISRSF